MEAQQQNYEQKAKDSLQKLLEEKLQAERQLQNAQVGIEWQPEMARFLNRICKLCSWELRGLPYQKLVYCSAALRIQAKAPNK